MWSAITVPSQRHTRDDQISDFILNNTKNNVRPLRIFPSMFDMGRQPSQACLSAGLSMRKLTYTHALPGIEGQVMTLLAVQGRSVVTPVLDACLQFSPHFGITGQTTSTRPWLPLFPPAPMPGDTWQLDPGHSLVFLLTFKGGNYLHKTLIKRDKVVRNVGGQVAGQN